MKKPTKKVVTNVKTSPKKTTTNGKAKAVKDGRYGAVVKTAKKSVSKKASSKKAK